MDVAYGAAGVAIYMGTCIVLREVFHPTGPIGMAWFVVLWCSAATTIAVFAFDLWRRERGR